MANVDFTRSAYSFLKKGVTARAVIDFGAAGAPTLEAWSPTANGVAGAYAAALTTAPNAFSLPGTQGVATVTRTSTGLFVCTLQDAYQRLLEVNPTWRLTAALLAANIANGTGIGLTSPKVEIVEDATDVTIASGGVVTFKTYGMTAGTPAVFPMVLVDPASGSRLVLELSLDDSPVL